MVTTKRRGDFVVSGEVGVAGRVGIVFFFALLSGVPKLHTRMVMLARRHQNNPSGQRVNF